MNFGAGKQKIDGYKSVDISEKCNPDYVRDITKIPYPKEWEGCEKIKMDNVAEHIEPYTLIKVINECRRILRPGGKLWIRVPLLLPKHEYLMGAFTDPTHVNYFTEETFQYWDKDHPRHKVFGRDYGIEGWKLIRNEKTPPKFLIVELQK